MKRTTVGMSICLLLCMSLFMVSCKKSSSNPTNPGSNLLGSGSLSFTGGTLGSFGFSGAWTGSASTGSGGAVEALTGVQDLVYGAIVYGYYWHSTTNWDLAWLYVANQGSALTPGTYTLGATNKGFQFWFEKGANSSSVNDSLEYILMSGTCTVTSYSSTGMKGTFSGTAVNLVNTTSTINVTNGSFDVTFGSQLYKR